MTRDDYYPGTVTLRHGKFRGVVRNIFVGTVVQCTHEHRTRSAALRCAKKLFVNLEAVGDDEE